MTSWRETQRSEENLHWDKHFPALFAITTSAHNAGVKGNLYNVLQGKNRGIT